MTTLQSDIERGGEIEMTLARRVQEISTLPTISQKVARVAGDPKAGPSDLIEAIASDPVLCARLLRDAHAVVGVLGYPATNLEHVVAALGMKHVRDAVLTATISDLFRMPGTIDVYCRSDLWRHMVAVAVAARMIARQINHDHPEDVFLAGLLHDLGIIVEDEQVHADFCRVIGSLEKGKTLTASERMLLGFDHASLGAVVAGLWGFSEGVRAAIRYHHMATAYRGAMPTSCCASRLAICFARCEESRRSGSISSGFRGRRFSALALKERDIPSLQTDLSRELADHARLFLL